MYYRSLDHVVEDCPKLIQKWQEKRNEILQMIATEVHEEKPKMAKIMHEGKITKVDATNKGNIIDQWVKESHRNIVLA
jgi:hypothetical protein